MQSYVQVLVADATFHGSEPLTYAAPNPIPLGSLCIVPLRSKQVLGIVTKMTSKPQFTVKPITDVPNLPPLPQQSLASLTWMQTYYPAPLGILTHLYLPKQLPKRPQTMPAASPSTAHLPVLTTEQQIALAQVQPSGLHILHGETGSGKTRVYVELALRSFAAGKSVLILTPEIGLTAQLANTFTQVFGKRVILAHSQLTDAQREQAWQMLLEQTDPVVVIGARSALFSPLRSLGLIVIDESHEQAYKQDQAPYYQASVVAAHLASLHKAPLILGSATPSISDYYIASVKQRPIIRMSHQAITTPVQKSISVVDLKDRSLFSKSPYLSNALISVVKTALQNNEQSLLYLNRRGTARVVFCQTCGWQALCPHCDIPLVYHGDAHHIRCHSCDYKAAAPASCPSCKAVTVVFKSVGTKAITSEVERLFPEARIMRFDADNKKDERIEQHYEAIKTGAIDILIGTQTLAKGLDLPKLSVVGVLVADTSLYFPDFSAGERTYQLLVQVLGRIGRGHRAGKAVIQTYEPGSALLQTVIKKDWPTFYANEITERQTFRFPPFCFLLKLTCRRASSASAERAATQLAQTIRAAGLAVEIDGPAPAFHEKVQNKFCWQIIIKSKTRGSLLQIVGKLPSGWGYDIDPLTLL